MATVWPQLQWALNFLCFEQIMQINVYQAEKFVIFLLHQEDLSFQPMKFQHFLSTILTHTTCDSTVLWQEKSIGWEQWKFVVW